MTGTPSAACGDQRREGAFWRDALAPYERPRLGRSLMDIATSLVPYLALWAGMYLALDVSYWLVLILSVPAAGFLLRTFIIFHDCAHGAFLETKRANTWLGRMLGVVVFSPFQSWRQSHAVHHATAGDLDRRGVGDVQTLTVAEYGALPWLRRLAYRAFRNPAVMFGIGPTWALVIQPRFVPISARPRIRHSVIATNVALLLLVGGLCLLLGWREFLLVETPSVMLAAGAGVWLFYVQHQFDDTYWKSSDDWSYADAALRGSSYLKLPKVLQFFTANIGLHHVHHLSARIPNYNLQRAHDENEVFEQVPVLTARKAMRSSRLKVWDPASKQLVGFAAAKASHRRNSVPARPVTFTP
jgi:omega-6 fatty acid desaturase (delta-12 desaturase)